MSPSMSAAPVRNRPSLGRTSLGTGARRRVTVSHSKASRSTTDTSTNDVNTTSSKSTGVSIDTGEQNPTQENISEKGSAAGSSTTSSSPRPSTARNHQSIQQAEAAWQSGKSFYSTGKYLDAMESFSLALNRLGTDTGGRQRPTILGNRAAAFFMLERYVEAVEDCEHALTLDNSLAKLYLRMGRARLRLGLLPRAENDFRGCLQACQLQQQSGSALDTAVCKEAHDALTSVLQARQAQEEMYRYESVGSYEAALRQTEKILQICPHSLTACTLKGKALCQLRRYDLAKSYLEGILTRSHNTILKLHAHVAASFPPPDISKLDFVSTNPTSSSQSNLSFNSIESANAILWLGSELGRVYLSCIKNTKFCHLNCGDVIDSVYSVLASIENKMNLGSEWQWVRNERIRVTKLLEMKRLADRAFRENNFDKAINFYSEAIKVIPYDIKL